MKNISQQLLIVFGFIRLPRKYEVERDVAMSLVAIMSFVSIIANTILLLVIFKDPFKKLRTITAIILAFNSAANFGNSFMLFLDNVFYWCHGKLSPKLIVYLGVFTSTLYFIGNILHTVNIYGAIVFPVRYAIVAPKVRKLLVKCLCLAWFVLILVVIIPPYSLSDGKSYVKGVLTVLCILLGLLALIFGFLYIRIFQTLHARKEKLTLTFHLRRATRRGQAITKKNSEMSRTLFIHVVFFLITTIPASMILIVYLYCTTCDRIRLQLAALFSFPFCYSSLVFHPFLWLFRLRNYKRAMIHTFTCWIKGGETAKTNGSPPEDLGKSVGSESVKDFL